MHLYKINEKSIPLIIWRRHNLSQVYLFICYKSCVDVSVGLHADENRIEEDFKRGFSVKIDDGQETSIQLNHDFSKTFQFGVIDLIHLSKSTITMPIPLG